MLNTTTLLQCNDIFVRVVEMQEVYDAALITNGSTSEQAKRAKLRLESAFEEYRICMSAQGTDVYGNYISHLFGRDISPEEQQEKDGYKIVFAAI